MEVTIEPQVPKQNGPRKKDKIWAAVAGGGGTVTVGLVAYMIAQALAPVNNRIDTGLKDVKAEVGAVEQRLSKKIDERFDGIEKMVLHAEERNAKLQDKNDRLHERMELRLQNVELLVNGYKPKNRSSN